MDQYKSLNVLCCGKEYLPSLNENKYHKKSFDYVEIQDK
jgi:hypothetical protein